MDIDSDIYGNLPNTDNNDLYEKIEKLEQQNNLLQELIYSLEGDIEKLCGRITEMKKIQDNLSKNISELFKTAKAEIERKDRIIAELRAQLDSFFQRKTCNFSMKRERDKSPNVGKPPPEHAAKKMRHEEDNQVKRTHFKRSRSRSRSSERSRRLHNDRRNRFDRHNHDYDSRRINVSSRDEKLTRGFKSKNYINREHDKKEITKRDTTEVKKQTEMNIKDAEVKKKVELTKKKDFDKREVIIIIDKDDTIKTSYENAKMDKESAQNDLKEVTKVKNNVMSRDMVEGERNGTAIEQKEIDKASNSEKDLKEVTEEVTRKRGVDQKKIAVKRNAKGTLVKSHVVKAPNSICNKQESNDGEKKVSDANETSLNKQNEDLITNKEKSGVKVNTTIIVETANKLKERLEEEAKQATPVTLQFADFAKVGGDSVEVTKSKIVEVTRKLFEDSEDETQEVPPNAMDTTESCKKNVTKGVAGVKIEAVSKKLLGRLEDAKHDLQKTKVDFRVVANQRNKDEIVKTKNEVFMELFGSLEDDETEVVPTEVAHKKAADMDKTKEVDAETGQVLKKPIGRNSQEDDQISKKLCEDSASVGQTTAISEEIPNTEGKDVNKNKIDSSLKGRLDEETKQPIPGCIRLDGLNEVDYESEDKIKQMKIEEMSKNLFRQILEEVDDKQKTISVENEEQKITEDVVNRSKSEDLCVNLAESIKNSIDFTKKRHDMMYGEVSKEISMLVPQCMDTNTTLHKKEMTEDTKEKVNSKHSVKSQKIDRGRRKSESSKLTKNGEKIRGQLEENSISSVQNKDNKNSNEEKSSKVASKHQKLDKEKKKSESSKLTKDEKIIRQGQRAFNEQKVEKEKKNISSIQNEDNKNINEEEKGKKKSESSKVTKDNKIGEGQSAFFNEQKIDKEKEGISSIQNEDTKNTNTKKSEKGGKDEEKQLGALNNQKIDKEKKSITSIQNEDDKNTNKEEIVSKHQKIDKVKRKSVSSKLVEDGEKALTDQQIHKEKKNMSSIPNEDSKKTNIKNIEFLELPKDRKSVEEPLGALNDEKTDNEKKSTSSIQNEDDKNTYKEIVSKHQKICKGKRKSVSSTVAKDDEKALTDQQIHKETKNVSSIQNRDKYIIKEEKSEISSINDKPKSPKKSSPKDSKSKKTKENVKNKDDDSSGSFIEESDRVLRSTTRRNSRLQEETQKKEKKSETKLDLNPHVEPSDFTTVNLSHDGEIPVLHIAEDSHLVGNSTLLNLENCQPVITSSPIKSDSNVSLNLSGLNGSNSFGETRIFNISSGTKRRRIVLKMVD